MRFSNLLTPTLAGPPCGPDLDSAGDGDYFNYIIAAESRLPERFVNVATGRIFDRATINLDEEEAELSRLLDRSRDLRLLVLRAQFHAVSGSLKSFADCIEIIPALLSEFWSDIHPSDPEGDLTLRKVALEGLNDRIKVAMPLTYLVLFRDRRAGAVSLRTWQIASKPEIAYTEEAKIDLGVMTEAFSSDANEAVLVSAFDAADVCIRSLAAIRSKCMEEGDFEFTPVFETTLGVLNDIRTMLQSNVPALASASPASAEEETAVPEAFEAVREMQPEVRRKSAKVVAIESHREAKAALSSLEGYFTDNEPSSPALILVHQAKLLIGRPLVEALAALAPARFNSAVLHIDEKAGFFLDIEKMKQLTVAIAQQDEGGGILKRLTGPDPVIKSREQALGIMIGVEAFLAEREPSSPVPLLLSRARALMDRSFALILKEVFGDANKA